jgi:hypothetical protein
MHENRGKEAGGEVDGKEIEQKEHYDERTEPEKEEETEKRRKSEGVGVGSRESETENIFLNF